MFNGHVIRLPLKWHMATPSGDILSTSQQVLPALANLAAEVTIAELLIEAYGRFLGLVMLSERREEEARRDIRKNLAVGFAYSTPSEVA